MPDFIVLKRRTREAGASWEVHEPVDGNGLVFSNEHDARNEADSVAKRSLCAVWVLEIGGTVLPQLVFTYNTAEGV